MRLGALQIMWSMSARDVRVIRVGLMKCWCRLRESNIPRYLVVSRFSGWSMSMFVSPVTSRRPSHKVFNWLNKFSALSNYVWKVCSRSERYRIPSSMSLCLFRPAISSQRCSNSRGFYYFDIRSPFEGYTLSQVGPNTSPTDSIAVPENIYIAWNGDILQQMGIVF